MTLPTRDAPAAHLRLLGDYDLVVDGRSRTRDLAYDKPRLLLAMLALAQGKPVSRDELAAVLWPEAAAQGDGRARLRHALFTLRQVFADLPQALVVETSRLAVRVECFVVDVWDVMGFFAERGLQPAGRLRLYRGPLLDTFMLPEGQPLAAWRRGWQARIDMELAQCRTQLAARLSSQGHASAALDHAKRWVALWPDDEAGHRHLIRLLLAEGDRDAAMLAYEHCRQVLMERLGTVPHAETQALIGLERVMPAAAPDHRVVRERRFVALAVVAVVSHWRGDPQGSDEPAATRAADLAQARAHLVRLAEAMGAWVLPAHAGTALVYFGVHRAAERPVQQAAAFAERITQIGEDGPVVHAAGLHAERVHVADGERPDEGHVLSHDAERLAWHAQPGETLASRAAADRLDAAQVRTTGTQSDGAARLLPLSAETGVVRRMFGRSREFDELIRLWAHAQGGREPTAVLVRGQPGIGKTLLVQSMTEYVRQVGAESRVLRGTEDTVDAPGAPVWAWIRAQAPTVTRPAAEADEAFDLAALQTLGRRLGVRPETMQGWPAPGSIPDPAARRLAWQSALADLLLAPPASGKPLLLVWDNLHWTHPDAFDLLAHCLRRQLPFPCMVLLSARDEFTAPWPLRELPVLPLTPAALAELVVHRARGRRLAKRVRAAAMEDSGGVPLYVEQILRHAGSRHGEAYAPRVQDLVAARLQALPLALRELAGYVAAAGEDTSDTLLAILGHGESEQLSLRRHGLAQRTEHGQWRCLPVVCAGILQAMTARERREAHVRVAHGLIRQNAAPERVAYHLAAGRDPTASGWWLRAALVAVDAGDLRTASTCIEPVFATLTEKDASAYEAWLVRCAVSAGLNGPGAAATIEAAHHAAQLRPLGDPVANFACEWLGWLTSHGHRSHAETLQIAERLHRRALGMEGSTPRGCAAFSVGCEHLWLGDPVKAARMLRQAMQELPGSHPSSLPFRLFGEPRPLAHGMLAWCAALLGDTEEAIVLAEAAVAALSPGGNLMGHAIARVVLARVYYLGGHLAQATQAGEALLAMAEAAQSPLWQAVGALYASLPAIEAGSAAAIGVARDAVAAAAAGMPALEASLCSLLARGLIAAGECDEALEVLERATVAAERATARCLEPELLYLRGDAWARAGQRELARLTWREASAHAQRMGLTLYGRWADAQLAGMVEH